MIDESLMLEINYRFDFNQDKVNSWFRSPNKDLNYLAPEEMIVLGMQDKLEDYIISQIEGN